MRFKLSNRNLLTLIVLFAVALVSASILVFVASGRKRVIAEEYLAGRGVEVSFAFSDASWLRDTTGDLVGDAYVHGVQQVTINEKSATKGIGQSLKTLSPIKKLELDRVEIDSNLISTILELKVETISIANCKFVDGVPLGVPSSTQFLMVESCDLSDVSLEGLTTADELQELWLDNSNVEIDQLVGLRFPNLEVLSIVGMGTFPPDNLKSCFPLLQTLFVSSEVWSEVQEKEFEDTLGIRVVRSPLSPL